MDNESHGSNSTPETSKFGGLSSYHDNSNDVEVSSKISMSPMLSGRVLQFNFDAKHDEDDPRTTKLFCTEFPYYEVESMENGIAEFHKVQDMVKHERPLHCPCLDTEESLNGLELENSDLSVDCNQVSPNQRDSIDALWVKSTNLIVAASDLELAGKVGDDDKAAMHVRLADSDIKHFLVEYGHNGVDKTSKESNGTCNCSAVEGRCQDDGKEDDTHTPKADVLANQCESSAQKHPCSIDEDSDDVDRACHQASTDDSSTELQPSNGQHTNEDERKGNCIDNLREEESEANHYKKRAGEKQKKPTLLMVPLLKTVAKGTALIGIMFLLHLRSVCCGDQWRN